MKRWQRLTLAVFISLLLVGTGAILYVTRNEAYDLITAPMSTRNLPEQTPADYGLAYEDVTVTTPDGLKLVGWYIQSQNGAAVIVQHGYKADREELLNEAEMLARHGYGVLLTTVRAHDYSEGEQIYFGLKEMQDLEAWYQFLRTRDDVNPERIGMLGNSYGGMLAIRYAAQNPQIQAVVANSAFSSLNDTVETSVAYFTGLPPFPFVPLIVFWAEQELGFRSEDVDATKWIGKISPRPVFLMQGGADIIISSTSGQRLYDAAGEPRELWFEPDLGHVDFDTVLAEEYERRVIAFFDQYLPGR